MYHSPYRHPSPIRVPMNRAGLRNCGSVVKVDLRGLNVLHALLAVVAHGDQLIDRHDALMADDARSRERAGVTIEPHLLRRHAGDLDQRFLDLVLDHDIVVDRRRRRGESWRAVDGVGGAGHGPAGAGGRVAAAAPARHWRRRAASRQRTWGEPADGGGPGAACGRRRRRWRGRRQLRFHRLADLENLRGRILATRIIWIWSADDVLEALALDLLVILGPPFDEARS